MAVFEKQLRLDDVNPEYAAFVEKFKPKKTTDDCYTPENVFEAVAAWACAEYGIEREAIVRPFYPGGDYERYDYPDGCVVLDNPPFSILAQICNFYNAHGQPFFLFAPSLTVPLRDPRNCAIIADASIVYNNGAEVKTAFITNIETEYQLRTAPALTAAVDAANRENLRKIRKQVPKYEYPMEVITAALAQKYARYGVEYAVRKKDAQFVNALDAQKGKGKSVFGGGLLLSERAAAERAAAERAAAERADEVWELSERERQIVKMLGEHGKKSE